MPDRPRTLVAARRAESRVRGSRFIATAWPVAGEADAKCVIGRVKGEFPDATHHCWALRLMGAPGSLERSSDAGEPSGTAGGPILQVIRSAGLSNVVVVVTRYFGGVKLGRGGLARAYRDAVRSVLRDAPVAVAERLLDLEIEVAIDRDGELRHLIAGRGGRVTGARYGTGGRATLRVSLPEEALVALREALETITRGEASLRIKG